MQQRTSQLEAEYEAYKKTIKGCPFCPVRDNKIKAEYKYWTVVYNKFPYEHTISHYVIISKRHIENHKLRDITSEEREELFDIASTYPEMQFEHKGIGQQSINHLHFHLIKYE